MRARGQAFRTPVEAAAGAGLPESVERALDERDRGRRGTKALCAASRAGNGSPRTGDGGQCLGSLPLPDRAPTAAGGLVGRSCAGASVRTGVARFIEYVSSVVRLRGSDPSLSEWAGSAALHRSCRPGRSAQQRSAGRCSVGAHTPRNARASRRWYGSSPSASLSDRSSVQRCTATGLHGGPGEAPSAPSSCASDAPSGWRKTCSVILERRLAPCGGRGA